MMKSKEKYGVDFSFTHDIKSDWDVYYKHKAQEHICRYGVIIVNCAAGVPISDEDYLQKIVMMIEERKLPQFPEIDISYDYAVLVLKKNHYNLCGDIVGFLERAGGFLDTFYLKGHNPNIRGQKEKRYTDSPIVVIEREKQCFEVVTLCSINCFKVDGIVCTVRKDSGEKFDISLECIQIEGLLAIKLWLLRNGFKG